jgi:hypothetical protein
MQTHLSGSFQLLTHVVTCTSLYPFVGKLVNRLQGPESAWDLEMASEGLEDVAERLGSSLRPFQGVVG